MKIHYTFYFERRYDANITTMTMNQIYKTILTLGDLYYTQFIPETDYSPIDELLSKYYNDDYEITDILEMVNEAKANHFYLRIISKFRYLLFKFGKI